MGVIATLTIYIPISTLLISTNIIVNVLPDVLYSQYILNDLCLYFFSAIQQFSTHSLIVGYPRTPNSEAIPGNTKHNVHK